MAQRRSSVRRGQVGGKRKRGGRRPVEASRRRKVKPSRRTYSATSHFEVPLNVPKSMQGVKFNTYIKKVLRKVKPRLNINGASVRIMDNLMKDTLHQIASQAARKMGRRKVLKPKILLRALRKVMPRSLVMKADEHGQRALDRFLVRSRRR